MAADARGIFVTGTDTGVGKTYVAALVTRAMRAAGRSVGAYKPAASGCRRKPGGELISDDAESLWQAAGRPGELEQVCPQCFLAPLAPHLAARAEGREIDSRRLRSGVEYWRERCDFVVVEGAGGLFSPLGDAELNADLAADLGYPLWIVAANRLGTVHATLATIFAAQHYGKPLVISGVVLNDAFAADHADPSRELNADELRKQLARYGVPLTATIHHGQETLEELEFQTSRKA